ncbi:MAG: alpha/beta fold hydrolase [Planctomycetota bacterium]
MLRRRRREVWVEAGDGTLLYARQTWVPGATGTPMLCANGIGVSTIFWHYLEDHFAPTRPVICFDYRGHGESEAPRDFDRLTIEENARDAIAVLDAFGHERAILFGHSMGCQVVYTCAYQDPERVAALVPCLGALGAPVHTFLDREVLSLISFMISYRVGLAIPDVVTAVKKLLMTHPRGRQIVSWLARKAGLVHPTRMPQRDLDAYLDHFAQLLAGGVPAHGREHGHPQRRAPGGGDQAADPGRGRGARPVHALLPLGGGRRPPAQRAAVRVPRGLSRRDRGAAPGAARRGGVLPRGIRRRRGAGGQPLNGRAAQGSRA